MKYPPYAVMLFASNTNYLMPRSIKISFPTFSLKQKKKVN